MKAMVLAAGKGTRVRPITYSVPKPMIPLVRKPVIQSIFEYLRSYSIRDVVINTSYLSDKIESYFGDGDRFGMRMAFSFEGKKTNGKVEGIAVGSAGGMKKIQDHSGFFDETFIVLCGDALIDLDITKAVEFHRERKSIATIILKEVPREETSKYGVVCTDKSGRIVRFQEKPEPDAALSTTVNTGIYIFEPDIFDYIPSHSEYDIGGDLFPKLADLNLPFYGISLPFQWVDIGSVTDYWRATGLALTGGITNYKLPGEQIRSGVFVGTNQNIDFDKVDITGPVYIGSGVSIADDCKIEGPTVIGNNCIIESGVVIKQCIVDDYVCFRQFARLEEKIVFDEKCISPDGSYVSFQDSIMGLRLVDARNIDCINQTQLPLVANQ